MRALRTRALHRPRAPRAPHAPPARLKTFEQYLWGARQDIQGAAVQHVLSTVVQALQDNPDRTFCYAEMVRGFWGCRVGGWGARVCCVRLDVTPDTRRCAACRSCCRRTTPTQQVFFSAWWRRQPPRVQAAVRRLVAAGQLDFVNGGWVQHDEAAAHYAAMIDQTTRGHRCAGVACGCGRRSCGAPSSSTHVGRLHTASCVLRGSRRCSRCCTQVLERNLWRAPARGLADRPVWALGHAGGAAVGRRGL
jgi:hypothetical protein